MGHDLRYALRILARSPLFTAIAVLSLALGIGANTSMFSLLDQVLYRSLPVRDPKALVAFHVDEHSNGSSSSDNSQSVFSYPMYRDLRDRLRETGTVVSGVIARMGVPLSVSWNGQTERAYAESVSGNFFEVLGVTAAMGRALTPEDDGAPGAHPVVMLSHDYWVRRFAGEPGVLNAKVAINGHPMVVVGVAPGGFRGVLSGQSPDLYVPIAMKREVTPNWDGLDKRHDRWLNILARLGPGISPAQAQAAIQTVYHPILESELRQFPVHSKRAEQLILGRKIDLQPAAQGLNELQQSWQKPLVALMALVGLVLLIACANVANLLLARAASRRREMAIRLALGAGRGSLVRQFLIESLVIAVAGGLAGLLVAVWTTSALLHLLPADATGGWIAATLNGRMLLFTLALSVLTGLLFGLAPALQASRSRVASTLREQQAGLASASGGARFRRVLVVAQLALSLLLLVGAGLFARSLFNLLRVNPGFRAERLLTFAIDPALNGYSNERGYALFHDLQERLARMPGVVAVGAANPGPLTHSNRGSNVTVEGYRAREDEDMDVSRHAVGPGYFRALGTPIIRGREITERDLASPDTVVVVNEAFARRFFGTANPLGRHMMYGASNTRLPDREIVGVVRDFKHNSLRDAPEPSVYSTYTNEDSLTRMEFYVRSGRDTAALSTDVRRLVQQMDAALPVFDMQPVEVQVAESVQMDRLIAILSCAFGLLATLLAAIGLYGVVAYTVARRTAEIGIRVALGAVPRDVLWLVMRDVGTLVVLGLAIGLPLALALGRFIESQLFGLKAADPAIFGGASLALVLVAALSGWIPGRRAAHIDPVDALRHE
ncbi:MAG: ABC transporter permease [Bryobacteraceae bacterium]